MKEVNKHQNDLYSINQIEYNGFDKRYVADIINKFLMGCGYLIVQARRPYYEVDSLVNKLMHLSVKVDNLTIDNDYFEVSFVYRRKENNNIDLIEVCSDLWFEFEQPTFCFFMNKEDFAKYKDDVLHKKLSWNELVNLSSCYVIFRGIEQDVMWIGKSSDLKFEFFEESK